MKFLENAACAVGGLAIAGVVMLEAPELWAVALGALAVGLVAGTVNDKRGTYGPRS